MAIIALLVSLMASNLMQYIGIYGIIPDLFLILVVFNGIYFGSMYAMIFGFSAGLALDISSFHLFGFYALIYCIIGYLTSIPEKKIDFKNPITSGILVFIFLLIKAFLFLIIASVFLKPEQIVAYFTKNFFIELIYTVIVSIVIFFIYEKINNLLGSNKKNG